MTIKKIIELPDGETIRNSTALVAFTQDNITYHSSAAQLPTKTFHARTQSQIESELGVDLEIPDDEIAQIIIDDNFTITKPFKLGDGSGLQLVGGRIGLILGYTGSTEMFQNILPGTDDADDLIIKDLIINGDGTNDIFDVEVDSVVINEVRFTNFNNLGIIEVNSIKLLDMQSFFNLGTGLIIKNSISVEIQGWTNLSSGVTGTTVLSFLYDSTPFSAPSVFVDDFRGNMDAGNEMLFLDSSLADIAYVITRSPLPGNGNNFYQLGADFTGVTAVDSASMMGQVRFKTLIPHNVSIGQVVVLSNFPEITYNGTFVVIELPTASEFTVAGVPYVTDEVGDASSKSLNQTDIRVSSIHNAGQPDSMFLAEGRTTGTLLVDTIQDIFVPITNAVPVSGDFIQDSATERFSINDATGIITYNGLEPITVLISYELQALKASGSDQVVSVTMKISGTPQIKSEVDFVAPASPGIFVTSSRKIYKILPGDTFQLFLDNTTNNVNTDVLKLALVISRQ